MSKKVEVSYTPEQVIRSFEVILFSYLPSCYIGLIYTVFALLLKILAGNAPPGFIRPDTLKQALTSFGKDKFSEEEASEYVSRLDTDKKGEFINIAEYVRLMMKS
jgi:Ca2+-binding EF-hand superfamily protein